jgi:hypothetical protein
VPNCGLDQGQLEVREGEETFLCLVDGAFVEIGGTGDAGMTTGTLKGATGTGVIGTLGGAKRMGSLRSGPGLTVGCGVAGAGRGGATACLENWRAKTERCSRWRSSGRIEKVKHVFSCLFEMIFCIESGEGCFLWEEINSENITFFHRIREVAFAAATMFKRRSDGPPNFAVLTECSSRFGSNLCHNLCSWRSHGTVIEIVIAKNRCMGRQRRMHSG